MDESEFSELTVCIVGMGLMGGSMALALQGKVKRLIGVDNQPDVCRQVVERGIVDEADTNLQSGVGQARLVILAAPVRAIVEMLGTLDGWLADGATVIDTGSVKRPIVEAMNALPSRVRAIGGHPLCGKETSGIDAAEAHLYRGRTFALCDTERTDDEALGIAEMLCKSIGAQSYNIDAELHDSILARVSHVPAMLSAALVGSVMRDGKVEVMAGEMAASGFRDASRLAASDASMMTDILLTNADAIGETIAAVRAELDALLEIVQDGDANMLTARLKAIRQARIDWADVRGFGT